MLPVALTIAGSDPSGGAGIQADLKTFQRFGVYGEAVITLLTVQNTLRVDRVEVMPGELVAAQIRAVVEDIPPMAAKTGALGDAEVVEAVAELAASFSFPLVVDPVIISKHGLPLMAEPAIDTLRSKLLPRAWLLTPNLQEAARLGGVEVTTLAGMRDAARRLADLGARHVLVKGGHLAGNATDVLYDGHSFFEFSAERVPTPHTHGTGCTLSAAITAQLARGVALREAVQAAKTFIDAAIQSHPALGRGNGPVNHFA
jgi:hydroxymethylpyrimidine/phosphomethylpyrimidine kinase